MQATNGYIAANIDLFDFLEGSCLENIEGRAFKTETIKEINKAENATFEPFEIRLVSKSGRLTKIPYDGYIIDRNIYENIYDKETKEFESKSIGCFPSLHGIMEGEGFEELSVYSGINPTQLLSAAKALPDFSKDITLEFSQKGSTIKVKTKDPDTSQKTCCVLCNRVN